ncbi:MAG: hypothetical protein HY852_22165 [Bradyrhizobium sp.]|uniref:hypothetical protein n=1 Tax=Bradyrhizobium sp. TaxID=376 RepID=UPI0025C1EC10|nr:hypothetical protein [Bradyrhizobium sp.]MBI5264510.1 hypothetical protein [Bradyrhizobium sp.]
MAESIASAETRNRLLKVTAGGLVSGIATPLMVPLIDSINGFPRDIRLALLAVPFAIFVFFLVRRFGANRLWVALAAGLITMFAFVCAVNAAVWVDGLAGSVPKFVRNVLSGLAGGFAGTTVMALGFRLLSAGPRDPSAWVPMVITGTIAGALFAVDNALNLDKTSILFPVWQAGVAVALVGALLSRPGASKSAIDAA